MSSAATAGDSIMSEGESYFKLVKTKALDLKCTAVTAFKGAKVKAMKVASDKTVQVSAAGAAGGAVLLSGASGMLGLMLGGMGGAFVGMVPALFTFGLSIPAFATLGAGFGFFAGATVGGTAGAAGGGATGYAVYTKRAEIKSFSEKKYTQAKSTTETAWAAVVSKFADVKKLAKGKVDDMKALALSYYSKAQTKVGEKCACASEKAAAAKAKGIELVHDKSVQVGAVSAVGGAVACGSAGAATGMCTGTIIGGAVGIVPAIFTFGLSIPIGAAIGGSCGLVTGATVGGSAGFVGGGAAGYTAHAKRTDISTTVKGTIAKVNEGAEYMKDKASTSAAYVRAKMVGGTGGTD